MCVLCTNEKRMTDNKQVYVYGDNKWNWHMNDDFITLFFYALRDRIICFQLNYSNCCWKTGPYSIRLKNANES